MSLCSTINVHSQDEAFIGEIRMFAGNFPPRGWAFCEGQLLDVSQNDALFSILGTIYGGDGRTTFGLPDLRGRVPIHEGNGPGLTNRNLGSKGGTETNTLTVTQLPSHNHQLTIAVNTLLGTQADPTGFLASHRGAFSENPTQLQNLSGLSMSNTGNGQSINNHQPSIAIHYIIALVGVYPSRN